MRTIGGWFRICFIFTPNLAEMIHSKYIIFLQTGFYKLVTTRAHQLAGMHSSWLAAGGMLPGGADPVVPGNSRKREHSE